MEENKVHQLRRNLSVNPEMYIWTNITGTLVTDIQGSLYFLDWHKGKIMLTFSWTACFSSVTFNALLYYLLKI